LRGPEIPGDDPDSYLSMIVIGGSSTECFYLSDGDDWPVLAGRCLEDSVSPLWVNNAGLDGHSTFGHIILMRDFISGLKPDIVLFMIGANDVGREGTNIHVAWQIKGNLSFDSPEALIKSAAAHSETASLILNIYRYMRARRRGLAHRDMDLSALAHREPDERILNEMIASHREKFIPAFRERLLELIRIARDNGIEPVFATQPMLFGEGIDPQTGVDLATAVYDGATTGYVAWNLLQLYNETIIETAGQENTFAIDLAGLLRKDSRYFYDPLHFTVEGSAEVGRIICSELAPHLEVTHYDEIPDSIR
jgi:lysophospholipase L1-like esterase